MREFLLRPEAAAYLNKRGLKITKNTLQKMATTGGGPPYQLFGVYAVYTPPGLDAWADARLRTPRHSTSEDRDDARKVTVGEATAERAKQPPPPKNETPP